MDATKLPKWAQEYIKKIERERDVALKALNEYVDNQTPSSFYVDENECTGEQSGLSAKRRYIQTRRITIEHNGMQLDVYLRDGDMDLQWGDPNHAMRDVAFIPQSYQRAFLRPKKDMR